MMTHLPTSDSPSDLRLSVDISIKDKTKHLIRKSVHWLYVICMLSSFNKSNYLALGNNTLGIEVTCTVVKDLSSPVAQVNIRVFALS